MKKTEKKRPGRPPLDDAKKTRLEVRMTQGEKDGLLASALKAGKSLSDFVRGKLGLKPGGK
jgi:hypothetical protein